MSDQGQTLASFSLTHVHYDPSDPLSHLSAWLALFPQGLCIVYATLLLSTREFEIALAFLGQLGCEALNFILKRLIKEARPERTRALGKGYGMPSSHAQFSGFWAVYVGLWLWFRFNPRRKVHDVYSLTAEAVEEEEGESPVEDKSTTGSKDGKSSPPKGRGRKRRSDSSEDLDAPTEDLTDAVRSEPFPSAPASPESILTSSPVSPIYALQLHHPHLTKAFLTAVLFSIAIPVCVSRIYLGYHTRRQVYVGASVGSVCAIAWFVVTEYARRNGYVEMILDFSILRSLRVRDLCCEDDLVELGWNVWEQKRKRRRAKRRKSVRFANLPADSESPGSGKGMDHQARRRKRRN